MADPERDADIDAAFADIVSRWDGGGPSPTNPPWRPTPASAAVGGDQPPSGSGDKGTPGRATDDAAATGRTSDLGSPEPPPWRTDPTHAVADALLGDGPQDPTEDEGWVPPPPAPLPPATDRLFWGALGGLVLGPTLLLWLVLVRPAVSSWWTVCALLLVTAGFGCLVARLPASRDDGDPDAGARV